MRDKDTQFCSEGIAKHGEGIGGIDWHSVRTDSMSGDSKDDMIFFPVMFYKRD